MTFIIKYIFRLIHISSYGIFCALLFNEYIVSTSNIQISKIFYISLGLALSISGIINMIILLKENNFEKDKRYNFWKFLLYFKFIGFLFLTPLFDKLLYSDENPKIKKYSRGLFFLFALILSPFARFYREKYLIKGYNKIK